MVEKIIEDKNKKKHKNTKNTKTQPKTGHTNKKTQNT